MDSIREGHTMRNFPDVQASVPIFSSAVILFSRDSLGNAEVVT